MGGATTLTEVVDPTGGVHVGPITFVSYVGTIYVSR